MEQTLQPTQRRLANAIRALAMDAVETANSGHLCRLRAAR